MNITLDDVTDRLPENVLPLSEHDQNRVALFLTDAQEIISDAFTDEGRDLTEELATNPTLTNRVKRVIREMVSASIIIGPNINIQSASSTTGPVSDSITYRNIGTVSFSGITLDDDLRRILGLSTAVRSRGKFPRPPRWYERRLP